MIGVLTIQLQAQPVELVKDINTTPLTSSSHGSSLPESLFTFQNKIYFSATDGTNSNQLWVTDGTATGTKLFKNFALGQDKCQNFISLNTQKFVFEAHGLDDRTELWVSDGTVNGTVMLKRFAETHFPDLSNFKIFNGKIYFTDPNSQLWVTDGTAAGTKMIKAIEVGSGTGSSLVIYNNKLYFSSLGLWTSDGTTAGTVKISNADPFDGMCVYNGKLYFSNNGKLWITDGTSVGTKQVTATPQGIENLAVYNNKLYFSANDGTHGNELWVSDGTITGTKMLKDLVPGSVDSMPFDFIVFSGKLYFTAYNNSGRDFWVTDGSINGTKRFKDVAPIFNAANPRTMHVFDNKMYLSASDAVNGFQLWVTDGTSNGTALLKPTNGALRKDAALSLSGFTKLNGYIYFCGNYSVIGYELYRVSEQQQLAREISSSEETEMDNNKISIYPNPATDFINVNVNETTQLIITDVQGQIVLNKSIVSLEQIDLADFKAGIYFITSVDKSDKRTVTKFIKQ